MRRLASSIVIAPVFMVGCAARLNKPVGTVGTLAELRNVRPDVQYVKVEEGLDQPMQHYRRFLEEARETAMPPQSCPRLANLQLENQIATRPRKANPHAIPA